MTTRNLTAAVSWLGLGNLMVRGVSLITMPILTRYLSPNAYGAAALAGTLVSLASVVALAGIDMSYSRHAYTWDRGGAAPVEAFCWRWALVAGAIAAGLAGLVWLAVAKHLDVPAPLAAFVSLGVFFSAVVAMAKMRGRLQNRYAALSWAQFAAGCTAAGVSISIAVFWRQDAWPLLVAMVVGYALPVFLLGTPGRRLFSPSGLTRNQRWGVFNTGLAGVVTAPAYWVLSSSDRWFLAAYQGSDAVGIYSIGVTVGTVGLIVGSAITEAWLPELARDESTAGVGYSDTKRVAIELLIAILLIAAVAVSAAGGDVIRALADKRFHAATKVVPWLAAGVMFYGVMHIGNALLVMKNKLHWSAIAWAVALPVSLVMNWMLVPNYGLLGAAFSQASSFIVPMALVWLAVRHFDPVPLQWQRLVGGFALAALVAWFMHGEWAASPWLSLLGKVPVGLGFSLVCLRVISPGTLTSALQRLKGVH